MNEAELRRNPHLTEYVVQDLNVHPRFEGLGDGVLDAVICNASVDYLTRPVQVFAEMRRVLREGGSAHMMFSNRCFPSKVVGRWLHMSDAERRRWVGGYFWAAGGWEEVEEVILKGEQETGDPVFIVRGRKVGG